MLAICSIASAQDMKDMNVSKKDTTRNNVAMSNKMMATAGLVPPGIMVGEKGKWMIGYQVMFDKMRDNLDGANAISNEKILQNFMATPTDMLMQMHMAMVMYSLTNKLSLMLMLPYTQKSMNHITQTGETFTERTNGIGDIELRGLYSLYAGKDQRHQLLLNFGVGIPTGSINQRMGEMRLEYPMQLGSGTVSVIPGFTYFGTTASWGWGAEFIPKLQLGTNSNGYRLGNSYEPSIWLARKVTPWLSVSANANVKLWSKIIGEDAELDKMDEPTKDPLLQGGKRIDLTLGANIHPTSKFFNGQQFFVHISKPVLQSLNGPQLQNRDVIKLGWLWEIN